MIRISLILSITMLFSFNGFACDEKGLKTCIKAKGGFSCYTKHKCNDQSLFLSEFCENFDYKNCLKYKGGDKCVQKKDQCKNLELQNLVKEFFGKSGDVTPYTKFGNAPLGECGNAEEKKAEYAKIIKCSKILDSLKAQEKLLKTPYLSQNKNLKNPGGTCQNTSIAMAINHVKGSKIKPDDLTNNSTYTNSVGKSPEGAARILTDYGVKAKNSRTMTAKDLKFNLSQGRPAVVNGYFTDYGHVVLVVGFDPKTKEYIVHDPNGKWKEKVRGGYTPDLNGDKVRYAAKNFEDAVVVDGKMWAAVASADGKDFSIKAPKSFKLPTTKEIKECVSLEVEKRKMWKKKMENKK